MSWSSDKKWSDRFMPTIKSILGQVMFRTAPLVEDATRNTDLIVLRAGDIRVACRIRRHDHLARFGEEFTLRAGRVSGAKTELAKVLDGWGDFMFYGFADGAGDGLSQWVIGDLGVFRQWISKQIGQHPGFDPWDFGDHRANRDGETFFVAYKWDDIGDGIVVASGFDAGTIPSVHYMREAAPAGGQ